LQPNWDEAELIRTCRVAYARRIAAVAGLAPGNAIEAALAAIPREQFAGPPPWKILSPGDRFRATTSDPAALYQDVLVALCVGAGLNNGQPSLHALCLRALAPQTGEHAVHVGAGLGYYTALLATLVGETGHVDAYEIEPDLAARARQNLAGFPQVAVHGRSGAEGPLPPSDLLYVNAAAAEPLAVWLDALRPDGRLLFPLAPDDGSGLMLLVARKATGPYTTEFLCPVQFVPCAGAQDERAGRALKAALKRGFNRQVRWLHRDNMPGERCWCAGNGWWLEEA
jgi:protein-L-isoaspartate(D-aspartate) O-methyltransferase